MQPSWARTSLPQLPSTHILADWPSAAHTLRLGWPLTANQREAPQIHAFPAIEPYLAQRLNNRSGRRSPTC